MRLKRVIFQNLEDNSLKSFIQNPNHAFSESIVMSSSTIAMAIISAAGFLCGFILLRLNKKAIAEAQAAGTVEA